MSRPYRQLQRNALAFAKLFNFNFLNYFHLNAYWIYVLGTTALPFIERLLKCGKSTQKPRGKGEDDANRVRRLKKLFRHIVSYFFTTSLCNVFKRFSSALFTRMFANRRSRIQLHARTHQSQQPAANNLIVGAFCFSFHFIPFVITATLTSYQITSGIVNHFFGPIEFLDSIEFFHRRFSTGDFSFHLFFLVFLCLNKERTVWVK